MVLYVSKNFFKPSRLKLKNQEPADQSILSTGQRPTVRFQFFDDVFEAFLLIFEAGVLLKLNFIGRFLLKAKKETK